MNAIDKAIKRLSREHPENPLLGGYYPHITAWRCSSCHLSYRIAEAKEREWCMSCCEPLRLLTPPLSVPTEPM
jgi:PHP family Zn ribbon phosphoesterase